MSYLFFIQFPLVQISDFVVCSLEKIVYPSRTGDDFNGLDKKCSPEL